MFKSGQRFSLYLASAEYSMTYSGQNDSYISGKLSYLSALSVKHMGFHQRNIPRITFLRINTNENTISSSITAGPTVYAHTKSITGERKKMTVAIVTTQHSFTIFLHFGL